MGLGLHEGQAGLELGWPPQDKAHLLSCLYRVKPGPQPQSPLRATPQPFRWPCSPCADRPLASGAPFPPHKCVENECMETRCPAFYRWSTWSRHPGHPAWASGPLNFPLTEPIFGSSSLWRQNVLKTQVLKSWVCHVCWDSWFPYQENGDFIDEDTEAQISDVICLKSQLGNDSGYQFQAL